MHQQKIKRWQLDLFILMVNNQQINTDSYQQHVYVWTVGGDNILLNQDVFESTTGLCEQVIWFLKELADRNPSLGKILYRNLTKSREKEAWGPFQRIF